MDFFKRHAYWFYSFAVAILLVTSYSLTLAPPPNFPSGDIIVISRGASVSDITRELSDEHIVKSPTALWFVLRVTGAGSRVRAGAYLFGAPEDMLTVAYRLFKGDYGLPPVRITFPEGVTVRDVAGKISDSFQTISTGDFILAGKSQEGYLFPDTYLFPPDANTESIMKTMRANFDTKIKSLDADITASGRSIADTVTMASLVEKEARTDENRKIIAGILWERLALGMPLQVDAVFGYIFDRDTYSPSLSDLTTESPYNLYLHKDLPPGPIDNPGLESIQAVLHPTKTNYLFYLTDKNGMMHYATTFAEHQANQRKYLK